MRVHLKNLGPKVLAVLLALLVHMHVVTEKEHVREMDLALRVTGLPSGLVLEPGTPASVRVRVRAKEKLRPFLALKPPEVIVDLARARPGPVRRVLTPADVRLHLVLPVEITEIVAPTQVLFDVDTLVAVELPVRVVTEGALPAGMSMTGPLEVDPPWVLVRGPSRRLAALDRVPTAPLDLARVTENRKPVELRVAPGVATLRPEPAVVHVVVPARRVGAKAFSCVRVRVDGARAAVAIPDTAFVRVEGPLDVLDTLDVRSLEVRLSARGLSPGRHVVEGRILPLGNGLRVLATVPARFIVVVTRGGS